MRPIALILLTLAVAHASVTVTRTSNDGLHPSTMEIAVALPDSNNNILIPLTRTDAFEDIPITLIDNGVSRTFSSRQVHHPSHSHYRHVDSKSVISVRHVNGKRQISGHVMHEGTSYFLKPFGESEHRVMRKHPSNSSFYRSNDIQMPYRRGRSLKSLTAAFTVELFLLLDSTVWSAFKKIYGSERNALMELNFYYAHILNGVDIVYRNIASPTISIRCIGMTLSKTATDDKWMPLLSVDGDSILKTMTHYISGKTADHFMAFTRKDITGEGRSSTSGMSFVGGICRDTRVSISEDKGLHSWGTAAHELGHNLGSLHDSRLTAECNAGRKYIMSPSIGSLSLDNVANSYRFSPCSIASISKHIRSLGRSNCLLSLTGNPHLPQLASTKPEGARLSLDQVCRLTFVNSLGKFMPIADANPESICAVLYCQTLPSMGETSSGLRAPVGTPCGSRKTCDWNGHCSFDATAAAADDSCFWGDTWSEANCRTRKYIIQMGIHRCSRELMKGCCKTLGPLKQCAKLKDLS